MNRNHARFVCLLFIPLSLSGVDPQADLITALAQLHITLNDFLERIKPETTTSLTTQIKDALATATTWLTTQGALEAGKFKPDFSVEVASEAEKNTLIQQYEAEQQKLRDALDVYENWYTQVLKQPTDPELQKIQQQVQDLLQVFDQAKTKIEVKKEPEIEEVFKGFGFIDEQKPKADDDKAKLVNKWKTRTVSNYEGLTDQNAIKKAANTLVALGRAMKAAGMTTGDGEYIGVLAYLETYKDDLKNADERTQLEAVINTLVV